MTGFMGMGMAGAQGANMMNAINQQMAYPPQGGYPSGPQGYPPQGGYVPYQGYPQQPAPQAPTAPATGWTCACGAVNQGKFCSECGQPKPEPKAEGIWTCSCGTVNKGKFCSECGQPKPAAEWTCSCGTVNKGKFCSNCGAKRP